MMDFEQPPVFAERDRLKAALRAEREARERAEALVAAAYRDAADLIQRVAAGYSSIGDARADAIYLTAGNVASRTFADASAALDRIRQEAADEALERVAVIIEGSSYVTAIGGSRTLEPVSAALKGMDQHHATIAAVIRALKGGAK